MSFTARIIVRFGDADPAGLVYYPVIFHYFHMAMEEFFVALTGAPYARLLSDKRVGFPTVSVRAEFFAPLVYGDEVDVEVSVMRVGRSSVTFEYAARRASDGLLCARSEQVQVAMGLDTRRAVPVPDGLRRAFALGGAADG
jgi:4-hydroxybenzoyl-CoA thioesterase